MDFPEAGHDPVLLKPILNLLALPAGGVAVDCTLGRGGHAEHLAKALGPDGTLLAIDADPRNLEFARARLANVACNIRYFHANFAELSDVLRHAGIEAVHAILADLGISTNQLFDDRYGLSFAAAMPLDMRINPDSPITAADLVNKLSEVDLANVLYKNAQEHYSRRISRKIAEARRISPINTTDRLAELVRSAIPSPRTFGSGSRGGASQKIDPATRTFMALRMEVNRELPNLEALLSNAPRHLNAGGRLAVISFHSTEDRMVKQAFRAIGQSGQFDVLTPRPVAPDDDETARNPRSRSAKLRVVEKCRLP
jgi:16S rRNA (cytosine1402-N4)-methyltransferase